MIFTVELSGIASYRLQKDGNWRELVDSSLQGTDYTTDDPAEATALTPYSTEVDVGGTIYKVGPGVSQVGQSLGGGSTVYRRDFPTDVPSKEQLVKVIAAGDDDQTNSLILNVHGKFELRQRPPFDIFRNDPTVVVRHETFAAGNDYVGADAAKDESHINSLFSSSLQAWLNHLMTGRTQEYSGEPPTQLTEDVLSELEAVKRRWVPQY